MSQELPFERIKQVHDKYKYTVSGYVRNMQLLEIPESIILVILLFYYNTIESSILTDDECDKLLSLFDAQNKFQELGNYSYKLIYKGTRDGTEITHFVSKCHRKTNLLCIISTDDGNVFGGYTAMGWRNVNYSTYIDEKAFLFSIRSSKNYPPKIFNAIKEKVTIRTEMSFYCLFDINYAIWIKQTGTGGGCYPIRSFERPQHKFYFLGMDSSDDEDENNLDYDEVKEFSLSELEVFQIDHQLSKKE